MNYYIQGDAANADKIKAAFEKKGIDVLDFGFADKTVLYCSIGGCVQYLPYSINLMHILYCHPDYKELELPIEPKFKVGDWIVYENGDTFAGGFKEVQVKTVEEINRYTFTHNTNGSCNFIDRNCRLWTIADAKDGDVLAINWHEDDDSWEKIVIFKKYHTKGVNGLFNTPCVEGYGNTFKNGKLAFQEEVPYYSKTWTINLRPATKEQVTLLFAKMKEAGYQWDADKKELRKIQPHYDIKNFKPKQWVLVRDDDEWEWALTRFSHLSNGSVSLFVCINGASFQQCIPFEDNEKLLGTTDMCDEQYINW